MLIEAERSAFDIYSLIGDEDETAVAAISIAELGVGVEIANGRRAKVRRAFLDDVVASLPVLDYDLSVALAHTQLLVAVRKSGSPRGAHDLIIAATARSSGRTVVTTDRGGFVDLPGVRVRAPS